MLPGAGHCPRRADQGVAVVVSPLIALMQDLVGGHAVYLNSNLTSEEAQKIERQDGRPLGGAVCRARLLRFIHDEHECDAGIVYCQSHKKVEETAAWLESEGITALAYHAGLDADVRPVLKNHDWQTTLQQQAIGPNRFFPESAPSRFCCQWPA